MGKGKQTNILRSLEIALDILDRVEGSTIYEIQKRLNNYTDKEYRDMLEQIGSIYTYLKNKEK